MSVEQNNSLGIKANSYTKRTKVAKDNAAIAAIAISIAKHKNDPMAKRALVMKAGFLKFKARLLQKYGPIARSTYYKSISSMGTAPQKPQK